MHCDLADYIYISKFMQVNYSCFVLYKYIQAFRLAENIFHTHLQQVYRGIDPGHQTFIEAIHRF